MTVQRVVITGASGAIGSALAEAYAAPGVSLYLQGRNQAKLSAVAERCKSLGARVESRFMDVRDRAVLRGWLEEISALQSPDLIIINAGKNTHVGPQGEPENWEEVEAVLDTNLKSVMAAVHGVLPAMRRRGRGQIALISSLAAYYGLPMTPTYCASKAGVKVYGEALRGWLAPEGIRVNVVMPGYVASRMCHDMPGPKPFLWTPERAARVIKAGLAVNKARISFPFPLNLGCWFLAAMPAAWSAWILRLLNYRA